MRPLAKSVVVVVTRVKSPVIQQLLVYGGRNHYLVGISFYPRKTSRVSRPPGIRAAFSRSRWISNLTVMV
jgi:hypothetical protein